MDEFTSKLEKIKKRKLRKGAPRGRPPGAKSKTTLKQEEIHELFVQKMMPYFDELVEAGRKHALSDPKGWKAVMDHQKGSPASSVKADVVGDITVKIINYADGDTTPTSL